MIRENNFIPNYTINQVDSRNTMRKRKVLDEGVKAFDLHTKRAAKIEYTNMIKEEIRRMG